MKYLIAGLLIFGLFVVPVFLLGLGHQDYTLSLELRNDSPQPVEVKMEYLLPFGEGSLPKSLKLAPGEKVTTAQQTLSSEPESWVEMQYKGTKRRVSVDRRTLRTRPRGQNNIVISAVVASDGEIAISVR